MGDDDDVGEVGRSALRRTVAAVLRLAVGAGALAGGGFLAVSAMPADLPSETVSASALPPGTTTPTVVPASTTTVAPVGQARPADATTYEATLTDCRQDGADLRFWGTIRNLGPEATAYRVQVTSTGADGSVRLTGYADTGVAAPGGEVEWLFRTSWPADLPSAGAACTVTGVDAVTP